MKILHVTSHLNIGGIPRYVLSLAKGLIARGHQVMVASGGGVGEAHLRDMGAAHWQLPLHTSADFSPQIFLAQRQLAARLAREPLDILHAHTRVGQVAAEYAARRLSVPYVTTWHGVFKRRLGRRLWPCTGHLTIAISDLVRRHLLDEFGVPEARIRLVHNAIDAAHYAAPVRREAVEAYRKQVGLAAGQPVVGSVGRLAAGRVKGFDTLLSAASLLAKDVPQLQVLIAGDGPRRPFLEDIARRLRIRDRVHFVGAVEDIRLPLALIDVFAFSSRWPEGFGLTVIEAMAAGKAIVATRAGAAPEIIEHGVHGWLVPPDNPVLLAEGIAHLLQDRSLARSLGQAAQAHALQAFSLEQMTTQVEAVYREALQHAPGAENLPSRI